MVNPHGPEFMATNGGYQLEPHESIRLDLTQPPLYDEAYGQEHFGATHPVITVIQAGGQRFGLLDARNHGMLAPFLLRQSQESLRDNADGVTAVRPGKRVIIGSGITPPVFEYDAGVAAKQCEIALSDDYELTITNLKPDTPTVVWGNLQTQLTVPRRNNFGPATDAAPHGTYAGYPLIGDLTEDVRGGVFINIDPPSEAIIVDSNHAELEIWDNGFPHAVEMALDPSIEDFIPKALGIVASSAAGLVVYDKKHIARIEAWTTPLKESHGLIGLSTLAKLRFGTPLHQALMAALFTNTLVTELMVPEGPVTVKTKLDASAPQDMLAWASYQPDDLEGYIIDPFNNFVGTDQEAQLTGRDYRRVIR